MGFLATGRVTGDTAPAIVVDQSCYWRQYYRFGTDQVSPAGMRAEAQKVLSKSRLERLRRETTRAMTRAGRDGFGVFRPSAVMLKAARGVGSNQALTAPKVDPARSDWRDYVFVRMFFDPYMAPPPPAEWMKAGFDDRSWVLRRGTFQGEMLNDLSAARTTGSMKDVHIASLQYIGGGLQACYYRTRFVVTDLAKADGVTLKLVYRGGIRVFVNGTEVVRRHLPAGKLVPDTPGESYRLAAYRDPRLRDRALAARVPADALRKGVNVLAVEVRASHLHPVVLSRKRSRSWNALHDREGMWRHAHLTKLELRSAPGGVASARVRPAGVQVWVADMHHRVKSTEFLPPGEPAGTIRIVAARNGTYSAQVVVGTDRDLRGLRVTPSSLRRVGRTEHLPAGSAGVSYLLPIPAAEFTDKLGDERGLGATFPDARRLAAFERMAAPGRPCIFDHITSARPATIPGGTCRPVWLSFRIPANAAPGTYRGTVEVTAARLAPVSLPVELEVVDWRLPDTGKFQAFVACEQNPYGVAARYGVKLWSDKHFRLMAASFRQLGRIGNTWLNVPVLRRTEFGNKDDSPIRWVRKADGSLAFDYTILDRYLDLAVKHWGRPRVVNFVVMHGMTAGLKPAPQAQVGVYDERTRRTSALPVGVPGPGGAATRGAWQKFARSLHAHMKARGLAKSMHWGYPLDREEYPRLRALLSGCVPDVYWVAGPHQIGSWGFKHPEFYKVFATVRYFGNWPTFRLDKGWKSQTVHLALPRVDSSILSLHTTSHPFAYRVLVDHALAMGRSGIARLGADEWAGIHYSGMRIPTWIVGMPVLFTLWPGPAGAETSARFEALREGVQEAEARIFLEQALERRRVPRQLAQRVEKALARHLNETSFFQNKLCIFELEKYHYRWQERSRKLYRLAAEVAKTLAADPSLPQSATKR